MLDEGLKMRCGGGGRDPLASLNRGEWEVTSICTSGVE